MQRDEFYKQIDAELADIMNDLRVLSRRMVSSQAVILQSCERLAAVRQTLAKHHDEATTGTTEVPSL